MVRLERAGGLPFVIGLGGHRDLCEEDVPALEARVREVMEDLRRRYPHTPLVVLSSLADGADRLGARVALALGLDVVAPLPLPREEYERDFATPASREEFASLLEQARDWFTVLVPPGSTREHAYARAAAFITQRSQLVIALWDGAPPRHEAGTGVLVRFALEGVPEGYGEPRSPLDTAERRPVIHILTPRGERRAPADTIIVRTEYPEGYGDPAAAHRAFDEIWNRVEGLNRDAACIRTPPRGPGADLLSDDEAGRLVPRVRATLATYAEADALSIHFQTRTRRTLAALLALAFVAAAALQGQSLAEAVSRALNGLYIGALGAAWGLWLWSRRAEYQKKYLDYRALAEGLRVQIFWRLVGLEDAAADHYLRKQRSELDWIRRAMRAHDLGPGWDGAGVAGEPVARLALVLERWVRPQSAYFARSAQRHDSRYRKIQRCGYGFFAVALVLAFAKPFLAAPNPLLVVVSLVPVVAALSQVWADRLALAPLAKQYGRMSLVFAAAEAALATAIDKGDDARGREIALELGVEALGENADWVILHRDRPVQVPGAK